MISRVVLILFCFIGLRAEGQILRDINFNYLYNPNKDFSFQWKIIRQADSYDVYYQIQTTDSSRALTAYSIEWELRASLSEKSGIAVTASPQIQEERTWKQEGKLSFPVNAQDQKILTAKIVHSTQKKAWVFYKNLPQKKSIYISDEGTMMRSFVSKNQQVSFTGFESQKPVLVSYYNDPFPSAAPPFSTSQAKVSKTIEPDSTFTLPFDAPIQLGKKGLYLAQQDTASAEGLAFRVEEDYPKLGKIESLAGPLIYICTNQEREKLNLAGSDKKKFDQVILSVTGNADRARNFMRSYFKRVELANEYFTSYKEGWKTDRGMIYIIFGLADEVYLFEDREVWEYRSGNNKIRFQFVKSPTLFDPENFVLIRDKKFTDNWYETIDLWRKARF